MSEINAYNLKLESPQVDKILSLNEFVTSNEGQEKIVSFMENLRNEVGNKESWEKTCQEADEEIKNNPLTEESFSKVMNVFDLYIDQMPPGHDRGHFYRDFLTSVVLCQSLKDKVAHPSELSAGLLAGSFHDIGTSIIPRYHDVKYGAGHAEVGAYLFWQISEGILSQNLRKLSAYSIAAHAHYLKPLESQIPNNYKKEPYWDDIWTDENDKLNGVTIQITRRADRSDTNGITLMFRHINSKMDCIGEGGQDISGEEWVSSNYDSLFQILNPVVRDPIPNPPSTLEHMYRFAASNHGNSIYSVNDHYFPEFENLIDFKIDQINELVNVMNHSDEKIEDELNSLKNINSILKKSSKSSDEKFQKSWENFVSIWNKLPEISKSRWINGFKYSQEAYQEILNYYKEKTVNSDFKNISQDIIQKLEK